MNIYEETAKHIANQVMKEHDDLLFSWLEPYGLTRENIEEYAPRILVERSSDYRFQRYFLDGRYIFTVEEIWNWDYSDPHHVSADVTFKQYFEDKRSSILDEEDD